MRGLNTDLYFPPLGTYCPASDDVHVSVGAVIVFQTTNSLDYIYNLSAYIRVFEPPCVKAEGECCIFVIEAEMKAYIMKMGKQATLSQTRAKLHTEHPWDGQDIRSATQ